MLKNVFNCLCLKGAAFQSLLFLCGKIYKSLILKPILIKDKKLSLVLQYIYVIFFHNVVDEYDIKRKNMVNVIINGKFCSQFQKTTVESGHCCSMLIFIEHV